MGKLIACNIITLVILATLTLYTSKHIYHQLHQQLDTHHVKQFNFSGMNTQQRETFKTLILKRIALDVIIISLVDLGYAEMALNFWETSLLKFNITNYIFICIDKKSQKILSDYGIVTYLYDNDDLDSSASFYMTDSYIKKTVLKVQLCDIVTSMGYNVLISDVDLNFLRNPLPYLTCEDCDIISQIDRKGVINTGFQLIKATPAATDFLRRTLDLSFKTNLTGQFAANEVVNSMLGLKVESLPQQKFCGGCDFRSVKHAGNRQIGNCVIMHNTCQGGLDNKCYQMKEMILWMVDKNGYYSNASQKYLTYNNRKDYFFDYDEYDMLMLAFEIGKHLNRTVILPTFFCTFTGEECDFLHKYQSTGILEHLPYREHFFLKHPKVPITIKQSQSPNISIKISGNEQNTMSKHEIILDSVISRNELSKAITSKLLEMDLNDYSVIRFSNMPVTSKHIIVSPVARVMFFVLLIICMIFKCKPSCNQFLMDSTRSMYNRT